MASQHETEKKKLLDQFRTNWDEITYPIAWPNLPFEIPDPEGTAGWVRWTILPGESQRQSLGSTYGVENVGLVIVQVFTPFEEDGYLNHELCDDVDEIYFNFKATDTSFVVRTRDAYVTVVGPDGAWWQQNVVVPYFRESIRSA